VKKSEYEKLAAFRYELRKFLHFSERAAEAAGLAVQQYLALLAIEGFPGRNEVTIGELAERLQILSHSAVGLVDRLETAGLVVRRPSARDRRRVNVILTPQGRDKLKKLAEAHREELRTAGPLLEGLLKQISALPSSGRR
jgi:DNA-binding MarR family transcriptional regulator